MILHNFTFTFYTRRCSQEVHDEHDQSLCYCPATRNCRMARTRLEINHIKFEYSNISQTINNGAQEQANDCQPPTIHQPPKSTTPHCRVHSCSVEQMCLPGYEFSPVLDSLQPLFGTFRDVICHFSCSQKTTRKASEWSALPEFNLVMDKRDADFH